jgi:peptidoglycan biosynthesis protein MviN/MurJ (putative lipid II flippase)
LYSMGKVRNYSLLSFVQALLNIGLSIFLGHKYGILGIIIATLLSICLSLFYIPYKTIRDLKLSIWEYLNEPVLKPMVVISFLGFGYYFLINNYITYDTFTWITMIASIGFGLIVLLSASYFILLRPEIKEFIKNRNLNLDIKT